MACGGNAVYCSTAARENTSAGLLSNQRRAGAGPAPAPIRAARPPTSAATGTIWKGASGGRVRWSNFSLFISLRRNGGHAAGLRGGRPGQGRSPALTRGPEPQVRADLLSVPAQVAAHEGPLRAEPPPSRRRGSLFIRRRGPGTARPGPDQNSGSARVLRAGGRAHRVGSARCRGGSGRYRGVRPRGDRAFPGADRTRFV